MKRYYFDNAASTPLDPQVRKTLNDFYASHYGNSEGMHMFARELKAHLDQSRAYMARFLGVKSSEIIFTGSATESNNFVLKGMAQRHNDKKHIIISAIEHASVVQTARYLTRLGFEVEELPVNNQGQIDPDQVKKRIRPNTLLVSVIWVNNELGTIQPLKEIGEICRQAGVYFHSDCVQGFAKLPLNAPQFHLDFLTASSHKIYGPVGAGLVYVRSGIELEPLLHGGGQEQGWRSSTVNVPAIVAFQKAVEIYDRERDAELQRIRNFRQKLLNRVQSEIPETRVNSPEDGVPHIVNLSFKDVDGELLAIYLDKQGIAVSTGSACSSGKVKGSRILQAIHLPDAFSRGTLRISFGRFTTDEQVEYLIKHLMTAVNKLRSMA